MFCYWVVCCSLNSGRLNSGYISCCMSRATTGSKCEEISSSLQLISFIAVSKSQALLLNPMVSRHSSSCDLDKNLTGISPNSCLLFVLDVLRWDLCLIHVNYKFSCLILYFSMKLFMSLTID